MNRNENGFSKEFIEAMVTRAVRTIAQTALSMLGVGMAMSDIDWTNVISVALVAGIISVLTSIATGLPETNDDGVIDYKNGSLVLDLTNAALDSEKDSIRVSLTDNLKKALNYNEDETDQNKEGEK